MAFESVPLSLETLGFLSGFAATAAAGTWAVSGLIHRRGIDKLQRELNISEIRASRNEGEADRKTREADALSDRLKFAEKQISNLEDDLRTKANPNALKIIDELRTQLQNLDALRTALAGEEDQLWKLRAPQPPADFLARMTASKTKVITVINYKGGVGKTTLVTGLSAHLAASRKRVLVIDFDYQGSLTRTMILGCRLSLGSHIKADRVIGDAFKARDLIDFGSDLGATLPGVKLITSGQTFDAFEFRTMLRWLLGETYDDVRFRLANLVLSPEVQDEFDYVLIDAPPRASTGAINALCASHALVIPTVLDGLSVDAAASFLARADASFRPLNPALDLAAVVGTLTETSNLTPTESQALDEVERALTHWSGRSHVCRNRIRHFRALAQAAGNGIAYRTDAKVRSAFDALGSELLRVLHENKPVPRHPAERSQALRAERSFPESGIATPI